MNLRLLGMVLLGLGWVGCAVDSDGAEEGDDAFSSANATLVDFRFDGELRAATKDNAEGRIRAQLMYSVGQLNGDRSVARLGSLSLKVTEAKNVSGGAANEAVRIRYEARVQVAWGKGTPPSKYELVLPRRVDEASVEAFTRTYGQEKRCTADRFHEITTTNYWFHYRPLGCALADSDVVRSAATVTKSALDTKASYPEYHRVWEDGVLSAVAVFGKSNPHANRPDDEGARAYEEFLQAAKANLGVTEVKRSQGGDIVADTTLQAKLADGRSLAITALLVEEVRSAGRGFDKRYAELVTGADVVLYNGHAGLGTNIRSLVGKGNFFPGKYQIFVLNGCDTLAYEDDTLAKARAPLNPDDPSGTRYMDIVTNVMPAYFDRLASTSITVLDMLLRHDAPKTYAEAFRRVDPRQIIVVTGDEDNVFRPGAPIGRGAPFTADGAVGKNEVERHVTPELEPGRYAVTLTPNPAAPGGDADLRLRIGAEPAAADRCKSYLYNSNELCVIDVTTRDKVYMTVTGDKTGVDSGYLLRLYPIAAR